MAVFADFLKLRFGINSASSALLAAKAAEEAGEAAAFAGLQAIVGALFDGGAGC